MDWTATATRADGTLIEWDGIDVIELRGDRVSGNYVYSFSRAPRVSDPPEGSTG